LFGVTGYGDLPMSDSELLFLGVPQNADEAGDFFSLIIE
jgi:hypothetical protein